MIKQRLYAQLVLIFALSLFALAGLAVSLWNATGIEQHEDELFQKTTSLVMMLLPPVDADMTAQAEAVRRVGDNMGFDLSLWSSTGELLGVRGTVVELPETPVAVNEWQPLREQTEWITKLADGRVLIVNVHDLPIPDDALVFIISLFLLAAFISLVSYPFIRRITKRLERLQDQVQQIGSGNLGARVTVEGADEIAMLAEAFNRTAEQIDGLVTAQRLLLANASHELRTPLTRIRLGIELLQTSDDPERRKALQVDINELNELINELILMTRLDTGLQTEAFEEIDLIALAAEECARYRDCELSGHSPAEVKGDRRMLQHLIRNLIDNAFVHGEAPVAVNVQQAKGTTKLAVSDGGEGIPEAEWENVFQPFYRARGKQNVPGYGLGLPLVKRIASHHGATILIESGSVSTISIVFEHSTMGDEGAVL